MKKNDIAMIILIASVSVGIAYGVVGAIPGLQQTSKSVEVDSIDAYSAEITEPDSKTFNGDAINPTVDVTIGDTSKQND